MEKSISRIAKTQKKWFKHKKAIWKDIWENLKTFSKGQSSQKWGWIIDTQGLTNMTIWYRGTGDRNEEGQEIMQI